MPRRSEIRTRYSERLAPVARAFRDHEGMTNHRILGWVEQFDDADLECGIKVLENVRYYSAGRIRQMLRRLVEMVYRSLKGVRQDRIFFVPMGRPGGGGNVLARALGDTPGIRRSQIKYMSEIERLAPTEVGGIVFIDDFSGTGNSFVEWWENVEMLVRPKEAPTVVAVLVLNHLAHNKISRFATRLVAVEHLTENDNVLSVLSTIFLHAEKETVLAYCRRTACVDRFEKGYGDCGLLVAFRHGCPNNSLPILWHESRHWQPLFKRRAM